MSDSAIQHIFPLGFVWETSDPFLFSVHHADDYPPGNEEFGPQASLEGRRLGEDFELRDGWRMYHGKTVPGFPEHPHRGFETVTVVLKGMVDHSDSHGAAGRYGNGDVQWMTAGRGLQHAEMFPLLNTEDRNPLELFQIWLNLPARKKFVDPHFRMLWSENIPVLDVEDAAKRRTRITLVAGTYGGTPAAAPAPDSWAAEADSEVAIVIIDMDPGAEWTLPAASAGLNRTLYCFEGEGMQVAGSGIEHYHAVVLKSDEAVSVRAGGVPCRMLLLQGRPIGEPVVQYGPFVMNSQEEIQQAFQDYQKTRFGGWPWERGDNVHGSERGRFARFQDGREETPPEA